MIDEGYIKYQCTLIKRFSISLAEITELNRWRNKLYQLGLIGQYDNGIGFGNLSIRDPQPKNYNSLIISGTQTGNLPNLNPEHYTKVIKFDWEKNSVTCIGLIQASSETLTHAAIYVANQDINAVIHVHHRQLWQQLINQVPTTDQNCAFGTPEMAREIMRLCQQDLTKKQKIIIMSGHEEGIITFGRNLDEAGKVLLNFYNQLQIN